MPISPQDFGASFKGFLDHMSAAAPLEEPIFRRRLRDHFEREPNELPTLSEKFPAYDHANLNSALEAEFADTDCSVATFGVINAHPYMSATLSMLAAPGKAGLMGGQGPAEGPVEYTNITYSPRTGRTFLNLRWLRARAAWIRLSKFHCPMRNAVSGYSSCTQTS
jgi:hypothetical protein